MAGWLEPGEEIQLSARPHGAALAGPLARAVGVAAAGGALVAGGVRVGWPLAVPGALLLAAGALLALVAVWRWDRTQVVLTTEKLFVVSGIVGRRAAAVRLARAGPVEVDQGLLGRLLGYGTVVVGDLEIPHVADPRGLCRLVR